MRLISIFSISLFALAACDEGKVNTFVGQDGGPDAIVEADSGVDGDMPDTGVDSGTDSGNDVDGGFDATLPDAGLDAEVVDLGTDSGIDAGTDVGVDSGFDAGVDAGFDSGVDAGLYMPICGNMIVDMGEDCDGGPNCEIDCTWTRWICADSVTDNGNVCAEVADPAPCVGETISSSSDYTVAMAIGIYSQATMNTSPLFLQLPNGILGRYLVCGWPAPINIKARFCAHYGANPNPSMCLRAVQQ